MVDERGCSSTDTWGIVSKNLEKQMEQIGVAISLEHLQETTLLGTARIL